MGEWTVHWGPDSLQIFCGFLIKAWEIQYEPGFYIVTVEELIEIDVDHRVKKPEDRLHVWIWHHLS